MRCKVLISVTDGYHIKMFIFPNTVMGSVYACPTQNTVMVSHKVEDECTQLMADIKYSLPGTATVLAWYDVPVTKLHITFESKDYFYLAHFCFIFEKKDDTMTFSGIKWLRDLA